MDYRYEKCSLCKNRRFSLKEGLLCGLTNSKPSFHVECPNYLYDIEEIQRAEVRKQLEKEREEDEKFDEILSSEGGIFIAPIYLFVNWIKKRRTSTSSKN